MKKKEFVVAVIRALFILLFLYAAFSKILAPQDFKNSMFAQPFSHWFSVLLLIAIPVTEIYAAILLYSEKRYRKGLRLSLVMMVLFTGYIALALAGFYKHIPCSCGGVISGFTWTQHLLFNLAFVLLAILAVLLGLKRNDEFPAKKRIPSKAC